MLIYSCLSNKTNLFQGLIKTAVLQRSRFGQFRCMMKWSINLVCPDGNHDPIPLPHKEIVYIGRTPLTRVVDPRCSRKQLQLTADLNSGDVQVVQLGGNSSALDGIEMIKDKVYTMKSKSTLHILTGMFPQKLHMVNNHHSHDISKSTSSKSSSSTNHVKDKHSSSNDKHSSSSKKRKLSNDNEQGSIFKIPKLSDDMTGSSKKSNSSIDKNNHDDDDLKSVSEKLEVLKQKAKSLKTPEKKSSSVTSPGSSSFSSSLSDGASGPRAPESRWDQYDSLYVFTSKGLQGRRKIAGFDIDGTIITTQSGKTFPTHPEDWRFLYIKDVPKKIKKLYADGYKIVFFTNQMGISRGKTQIADLKTKFADVLEELEVPIQILVSTKSNLFRKPAMGMWNFLCEKGNDGLEINKDETFFVGDAAGRPKDWMPKKKKDFSCGDRLFAINIGIEFKTPEEFFLGYPAARFEMPEFDPRKLSRKTPLLEPDTAQLNSESKEMIVMAGSPASGKTHFCKQHLVPKGYVHVNRDSLGTWQKCVTLCKESLKKGQSVVVDNTNPDPESRARYTAVAAHLGVPCRCFVMTTTHGHARHNERFREITDKSHQAINDIILNSYKKKYVPPEKKEGYTEIVKVNVVPKFSDPELKHLYKMFLMEK